MNVSSLRFASERAFKKFLRRDIFTAVQFDYPAIVERVGIPRQSQLSAQTGLGYGKISTSASGNLRHSRILFNQRAKQTSRFTEPTASEFFVRRLESAQGSGLVMGWLWWRRRR
jgi:hypothetical protein